MRVFLSLTCVSLMGASSSPASVFDLQADWSEVSNPNGQWEIREGTNPLPHVSDWQLAPWGTPQPGWARSGNTNIALPFFFLSNGTEQFAHDWAAGQVVLHSTDSANGVGSGPAIVHFAVPQSGLLTIAGGSWIGRDIDRSVIWTISLNDSPLTAGSLSSGDPYSSANPFLFSAGSGGATATSNIKVSVNDSLAFRFNTAGTSSFGDFVGLDIVISIEPAPPECAGDTNSDNIVNAADLSVLLGQFGGPAPPEFSADFNGDGIVNAADLSVLLGAFGSTCMP